MKKYTRFLGIVLLVSIVMGCVASQETKDMLGALGGGVVGGVIGKKSGGKERDGNWCRAWCRNWRYVDSLTD